MKTDKDNIIKISKNKKGIYLLYNNINNLYYVGSAVNLSRRFNQYYYA